ncbi:MAG: lysophospholipase [Desulfobacterales bacterium]|nr:lysophospholipase [Desulfobacterales bacterium]MBS3755226.1 lysophospholipase [Desulfobacterales bacterium]
MQNAASPSTGTLSAGDGTQLFFRQFPGPSPHRAGLVIAHGLCEHSGRYTALAERLAQKGLFVFAHDHRGHGQSGGKRGCIRQFADYTQDLHLFVEKCRNALAPNTPLLLLGHSMGGLIVLDYIRQFSDQASGVIVSCPALAPGFAPPRAKTAIARFISATWPSLTFDNELAPEYLSHDSAVVDAYIRDPLVHRRISARLFTEMMDAMARTRRNADAVSVPLLMQIAEEDRLVDPQRCRDFFKQVAAADKTLHEYPGLYHEIYNEEQEQREWVIGDLETWLQAHI